MIHDLSAWTGCVSVRVCLCVCWGEAQTLMGAFHHSYFSIQTLGNFFFYIYSGGSPRHQALESQLLGFSGVKMIQYFFGVSIQRSPGQAG